MHTEPTFYLLKNLPHIQNAKQADQTHLYPSLRVCDGRAPAGLGSPGPRRDRGSGWETGARVSALGSGTSAGRTAVTSLTNRFG